jgi:hypothetical protein
MKEKKMKFKEDFIGEIIDDVLESDVVYVPVLDTIKVDRITNKNISLPLRNTTMEQKKNWAELSEAMSEEHAERFNTILDDLSRSKPLEFVRVYLKALEFFQPKLIRTDGSEGIIKDNEIHITIKR